MKYIRVIYEGNPAKEEAVAENNLQLITKVDEWMVYKTSGDAWIVRRPARMGGTVRHQIPLDTTLLRLLLQSSDKETSEEIKKKLEELSIQ